MSDNRKKKIKAKPDLKIGATLDSERYFLFKKIEECKDTELWHAFDRENKYDVQIEVKRDTGKIIKSRQIQSGRRKKRLLLPVIALIITVALIFAFLQFVSLDRFDAPYARLMKRPPVDYHIAVIPEIYKDEVIDNNNRYIAPLVQYLLDRRTDIDIIDWFRVICHIENRSSDLSRIDAVSLDYKKIARNLDAQYLVFINAGEPTKKKQVDVIDLEEDRIIKTIELEEGTVIDAGMKIAEEIFSLFPGASSDNPEANIPTGSEASWKSFIDGYYLLLKDRPLSAVPLLRKSLEIDPSLIIARRPLAEALYFTGNRDEARKLLSDLYDKKNTLPPLEKIWIEADHHFLYLENPRHGRKYLRQILNRYPDQKQAYIYDLLWMTGRPYFYRHERRIQSIIMIDPMSPMGNRLYAINEIKSGRFNPAIRFVDNYAEFTGMNLESLLMMCELSIARESYSEASYLINLALQRLTDDKRKEDNNGYYFYTGLPETELLYQENWDNKIGPFVRSGIDLQMSLAWLAAGNGNIEAFLELSRRAYEGSEGNLQNELYCLVYRSIICFNYGIRNQIEQDWKEYLNKHKIEDEPFHHLIGQIYLHYFLNNFHAEKRTDMYDRFFPFLLRKIKNNQEKNLADMAITWSKMKYSLKGGNWKAVEKAGKRLYYLAGTGIESMLLPSPNRMKMDADLARMASQKLWDRLYLYYKDKTPLQNRDIYYPIMTHQHLIDAMFAYNPYLWDALINLDKKTEIKKIIDKVFPRNDDLDSINMRNPRDILRIADYYYSKEKYEDAGSCYKKFLKLWQQADKNLPEYRRAYERLLEIETNFNR